MTTGFVVIERTRVKSDPSARLIGYIGLATWTPGISTVLVTVEYCGTGVIDSGLFYDDEIRSIDGPESL